MCTSLIRSRDLGRFHCNTNSAIRLTTAVKVLIVQSNAFYLAKPKIQATAIALFFAASHQATTIA
jgi:hypothetical protein